MSDHDRTDEPLDKAMLDAYEVPSPPDDLADRVLIALGGATAEAERPAPRRGTRRARWGVGAGVVAAAGIVLWLAGSRWPTAVAGAASPTVRQSLRLGERGIAVAEAGANLSWKVASRGEARVEQTAGEVFYRVEKQGRFVVVTPAGDVTVEGTCFRVEVRPMRVTKEAMTGTVVGAALSAAILVTVYEGQVLVSNPQGETRLIAGERAGAEAGSPPRALGPGEQLAAVAGAATSLDPPAEGATRADLLARDQRQRQELASLRDHVKGLETRLAASEKGKGSNAVDETYVDPPKELLLEAAKECRLWYDLPTISVEPPEGFEFPPDLGVSTEEAQRIQAMHADFNTRTMDQLRALYVEVTGDEAGAETLSPRGLAEEILGKSPRQEQRGIFQRLSHERAGLASPPSDLRGTSAAERYHRLMMKIGDQFEGELAKILGADRAHQLRKENDGWGHKRGMSAGCPEEK